ARRLKGRGVSPQSRWNTLKLLARAGKALVAGPPRRAPNPARGVLFVSHAAFWRERKDGEPGRTMPYEHYFDRAIPGVEAEPELRSIVVAVGPRTAFRRRDARARLAEWLRWRREAGPYVHIERYTSPRVVRQVWRATG